MNKTALALVAVVLGVVPAVRLAAQHPAMPAGMTHEKHLAQMDKDRELKKRGAAAMGFDQETTAHHFRLSASGGSIEVMTNDAADIAGRDQIRTHLKDIATEFARGDFAKPFATHGAVPPGVKTMQSRKSTLAFGYQDLPNGGAVRITTKDAKARDAVHEFLRYQIREHATGDPLTASSKAGD
jgi:hypothetical protein